MDEKIEEESNKTAYEKRNLPKSLVIKGNMFKYKCRKNKRNYFIKINEENIKKLLNNEKSVIYEEYNEHTNIVSNLIPIKKSDTILTINNQKNLLMI